MRQFDRTEGGHISKKIDEAVQRTRIARVVEVFQHISDDDTCNFELDVEFLDEIDRQARTVPWQTAQNSDVKVPRAGDRVLVEFHGRDKPRPVAKNVVYTNEDRPPKALAGMWRKRIDSEESPAGKGDLYVESWTEYDNDPATVPPANSTPQKAYIRLGKKKDDLHETFNATDPDLPMFIELEDNPVDDEAHIHLQGNQVNGDDKKSTGVELDLKEETTEVRSVNDTDNEDMTVQLDIANGVLTVEGVDKDKGRTYQMEIDIRNGNAKLSGDTDTQEMGVKLNFDSGEFKVLDKNGYGITSDGAGNFDWYYSSIDHKQGQTTSL